MKTRIGYVSNSSVSSFLVVVKNTKVCKHCGRGEVGILELIDNAHEYNDDTKVCAVGFDAVRAYMTEYLSLEEKEAFDKKYMKYENSEDIAYVQIAHGEEHLISELDRQCKILEERD